MGLLYDALTRSSTGAGEGREAGELKAAPLWRQGGKGAHRDTLWSGGVEDQSAILDLPHVFGRPETDVLLRGVGYAVFAEERGLN